ncbi:MAG: hypothetical protein AAGB26_05410 [Planctomycetota bacterium]
MPTTKLQCVLVYALNMLLLFNLTVIVVLLTDQPDTPPREQAVVTSPQLKERADEAMEVEERPIEIVTTAAQPEPAVVVEAVAEPAPAARVSPQPLVLANPAVKPVAATQEQAPQPAVQADDPPIQFFGVGLD